MKNATTQAIAPSPEAPPEPAPKPAPRFKAADASAPENFAGAGAGLPENFLDDPAFYERVPLLRVCEELLHRAMRTHKSAYKADGKFYIAEVGTYRGRGLRAILEIAKFADTKVKVIGLDSFEGLPDISERDQQEAPSGAAYLKRRLFADTTLRETLAYIGDGFEGEFELVQGFFSDTLPKLPENQYLFVVIDCDLYSSHMETMQYFYDRLMPGGVMFFDDYYSKQYPMAKVAIDEFLETIPENLFHVGYGLPKGNNLKAYFIKR